MLSPFRLTSDDQSLREPDRQGRIRALSTAGFHDIAYTDWGAKNAERTVFCVHGLSRQGRDFDFLARDLADGGARVICSDLAGRGRSGHLRSALDYVFPQYCADLNNLLARTSSPQIDWVGSSLGGLIGLVFAAMPNSPVRRLVINDIAPSVPLGLTFSIGQRLLGMPSCFASLDDATRYFKTAFSDYGNLTEAQWHHVAKHSVMWCEKRKSHVTCYDHKITQAFHFFMYYGMTLWGQWSQITCPILILRGTKSDFLPPYLAAQMLRQNTNSRLIEFDGVGHMPMLMDPIQIDPIVEFLAH